MELAVAKRLGCKLKEVQNEVLLLRDECLKSDDEISTAFDSACERLDCIFQVLFVSLDNDKLDLKPQLYLMSICMGSILECALQLFLLTFSKHYESSNWQKWEGFDEDRVVVLIKDALTSAVSDGAMDQDQYDSTLKQIKAYFRKKRKEPSIESIMLYDLINFYCSNVLDDESSSQRFRQFADKVRCGRNCVHAFSKNDGSDSSDMLNLLNEFQSVLLELRRRAQYAHGTASPLVDALHDMRDANPNKTILINVLDLG